MKQITLKEVLTDLTNRILIRDNSVPDLYYKNNGYHLVDSVNLYSDRITCEDGYWNYFDYILQDEEEGIFDLYVDENT